MPTGTRPESVDRAMTSEGRWLVAAAWACTAVRRRLQGQRIWPKW